MTDRHVDDSTVAAPTRQHAALRLARLDDPARQRPKFLGRLNAGRSAGQLVGLPVPDGRHHLHVQGVTGVGKSTWLAHHVLAEADAGRGVLLLDPQGDLADHVIARLPDACRDRLVLIDPNETLAPAAFNILDTSRSRREVVADGVVTVFRRLYAESWGPRMDDLMRAACLTLTRLDGSTLADVPRLLGDHAFRRRLLDEVGEPAGLEGFWAAFDDTSATQRAAWTAPVTSRLRGVLSRPFARSLLGIATSTFDLRDVLDGGVLVARLPKGQLGEDCARLVGSLLISTLWTEITARAARSPEDRPDATIVIDECHNFLHLPIQLDDALAEARGYRVSFVLAHQHLAQLPVEIAAGIDANARNKVYFGVSPADARKLAAHIRPRLDEHDLATRPAREIVARPVLDGRDEPAFTLDTLPLPPAPPGRSRALRAAARARTGLPSHARARLEHTRLASAARGNTARSLQTELSDSGTRDHDGDENQSPCHSPRHWDPQSPTQL